MEATLPVANPIQNKALPVSVDVVDICVPSKRQPRSGLADIILQISTSLGNLILTDCRVLRSKLGVPFVALPCFNDATGFHPSVVCSGALRALINETILTEFENYVAAHPEVRP